MISPLIGELQSLNTIHRSQNTLFGNTQAMHTMIDGIRPNMTPAQISQMAKFGAYLETQNVVAQTQMTFAEKAMDMYRTMKKKAIDRFFGGLTSN